ncbi:hypothetical protein ACFP63_04130 [Oerskovia jenensis]|uniref:Uncharacterized protein n=1 Tax=Oerskovia jenensis TaxID=162169 RepID=A0ABS2LCI0_9CELL|nr:hypothetical protein [Oerskovia jenensis]MBM7478134.1 hypothetical protein [Oerskovia jenensis]
MRYRVYTCLTTVITTNRAEANVLPAGAAVFTTSRAEARRLMHASGLRGKPEAGRPFELAIQHPDVVVWQTVDQAERSPDEWNVGITVAEYVERGGI